MEESKIVEFVKSRVKPLTGSGKNSPIYRCSAILKDGFYLPCVCINSRQAMIRLAMRRFQECRDAEPKGIKRIFGKAKPKNMMNDYTEIVGIFTCTGNRVNYYEIDSLEESPFAIPPDRMAEINGETTMNWTQFTVCMRDGNEYQYGTTYSQMFFNMPEGYSAKDIVKIIPAARGQGLPWNSKMVFREKTYFDCYIDGI